MPGQRVNKQVYSIFKLVFSNVLINRTPFGVFADDDPNNVLFPNKLLFSMEPRVFESTCYIRDVRPFVTKLKPKALKCFFMGYSFLQKITFLYY